MKLRSSVPVFRFSMHSEKLHLNLTLTYINKDTHFVPNASIARKYIDFRPADIWRSLQRLRSMVGQPGDCLLIAFDNIFENIQYGIRVFLLLGCKQAALPLNSLGIRNWFVEFLSGKFPETLAGTTDLHRRALLSLHYNTSDILRRSLW